MTGITGPLDATLAVSLGGAGNSVSSSADAVQPDGPVLSESAVVTPSGPVDTPEAPPGPYPGQPVAAENAKPRSVIALLQWVAHVLAERPRIALAMQARFGIRKVIDLLW